MRSLTAQLDAGGLSMGPEGIGSWEPGVRRALARTQYRSFRATL